MAKQRNSLGVLVLPVPTNEKISWDEYKDLYGIDLNTLFVVSFDSDLYEVYFNPACSKLILLSAGGSALNYTEGMMRVSVPNAKPTFNSASTAGSAYLALHVSDSASDRGYSIMLYGDKTVSGGTY